MRIKWPICALVLSVSLGVAAQAQEAATPCPPPRQRPAGPAPTTGNASSLNPAMNAETDVPKGSPLEGLPNPFKPEFDWAKMPAGRAWGDDRAIAIDKDGMHIWVADRCSLGQGALHGAAVDASTAHILLALRPRT